MRGIRRGARLVTVALLGFLAAGVAGLPVALGACGEPVVVPGKVTLSLGVRSLGPGDLIRIAVVNGLRQTIYTEDMKSDCSIVLLERYSGGAWQPLPGCALGRAPRVVAIAPGQVRPVEINPRSIHFLSGAPKEPGRSPIGAGTYRIRFGYRLARGPEGEETHVVHSELFRVAP
ncbi:MAG: hypothetical protein QME77_08845 [bacterium]|nr:hypothetical protein [bacterium]